MNTTNTLRSVSHKWWAIGQITFIYFFIVLIVKFLPTRQYDFYILGGTVLFSVRIFKDLLAKKGWIDLGFLSWKKVFYGWHYYLLATTLCCGVIIFANQKFNLWQPKDIATESLFHNTIGCGFQEILFRIILLELLIGVLKERKKLIFFISVCLFTWMHIIYGNYIDILLITFVGGILYNYLYIKKKNFYLIAASHAVITNTLVWQGLF